MSTAEPHVEQAGLLLAGVHPLLLLDWALLIVAPAELDVLAHAVHTELGLPGNNHPLISS